MNPMQRAALLVCIMMSLVGCEAEQTLPKAKQGSFARSEYYPVVSDPQKATYYQPVEIDQVLPHLPQSLKQHLNLIDPGQLPFPVEKPTAFLVQFQSGGKEKLQHQLQLTYLREKDEYGREGNEFFIIRMTEVGENPFALMKEIQPGLDTFGNKIEVEPLREDVPMYHHIIQTNSSPVYTYYVWNEKEKQVNLLATRANEIDFYHDGVWYQIAYLINGNQVDEQVQKQMVELVKHMIK
ncbi:hypothetical protein NDK47_22260 [Brevibacillus ruminantium]|uniref:Lipoprotein n=1 Tax=Brevibacillus ruminantium TaxID=2950604 RepID=A0ABY4WHK1_9BACL|nr:hypothetical protein [Brevibacillus ruminantium]USG64819.1 hypothetical protein NDK47_22260 [Brevibacillus ruminantium]